MTSVKPGADGSCTLRDMQLVRLDGACLAALRILIAIARRPGGLREGDVGPFRDLPPVDVRAGLRSLLGAGLVTLDEATRRYRLAAPAGEIRLADVITATDPELVMTCPFAEPDCSSGGRCRACGTLLEAELALTESFGCRTLAELAGARNATVR